MKIKYLILIAVINLISFISYGQCSAGYYKIDFITEKGDTINKVDSLGFYQGLHIYSDNYKYVNNDTTAYIMGYYKDGQPIGLWTNHCKDNSYSIGNYNSGIEVKYDNKGVGTQKRQGIFDKINEWKYYNADSTLIKTETYINTHDNEGWTRETYLTTESGKKVLIEYNFNSKHNLDSKDEKEINLKYSKDGKLIFKKINNYYKDIEVEYYSNGKIKSKFKLRKVLFGFKILKPIASPDFG